MRSIIGNKLASLYQFRKQNTKCWILYTNLQNKIIQTGHYFWKIAKKSGKVYCFKTSAWVGIFPQYLIGRGVGIKMS